MNTNILFRSSGSGVSSSAPSLSLLSGGVLGAFRLMRGEDSRLFKLLYNALWRYLFPVADMDNVAFVYAVPLALPLLPVVISPTKFFLLSRLWVLSGRGAHAVNTMDHTFTHTERTYIAHLKDLGLIVRTSFDPAHPHNSKPSHIQRTYISFTSSGVVYYKQAIITVNRIVKNELMSVYVPPK